MVTTDFGSYCQEKMDGWGTEAHGEGLTCIWTEILSSVKDWLPLIGEVSGCKGVLLCAGVSQARNFRGFWNLIDIILSLPVTACLESSRALKAMPIP